MKRHFQSVEICGHPVQFFIEDGFAFLYSTDLSIAIGYTGGSGNLGALNDNERRTVKNRNFIRHDAIGTFFAGATGDRKKQREKAVAEILSRFASGGVIAIQGGALSKRSDVVSRIVSAGESLQDFFDDCEKQGFDCGALMAAAGVDRLQYKRPEPKVVTGGFQKCLP